MAMSETAQNCNIVDQIIDYESGLMEEEDVPGFFQRLYDTGVLAGLQGSYHRAFAHLKSHGLVETR